MAHPQLIGWLSIRPARADDAAFMVALWRACGLTMPYNDPDADFAFALGGAESDILVGVDAEGRIRCSVMVGQDGHRGWLYYVAADPQARRIGIGWQMVAAAETWLQARGIRKARLLVRESNAAVVSFYERLGFEVSPSIMMGKWLAP